MTTITSLNPQSFSKRLLAWYDLHGRKHLPWQKNLSDEKNSPYRVWVSEIMLQQTQVSTAIPYYEKFIQQFPTVEALAKAPQDEVLHYWSGLGFYARARNLHATAIVIVEKFQGKFPSEALELTRLPGIGPSTAGAIISIAFKKRAAILDGNVKRVLARHFVLEGVPTGKIEKLFWKIAEELTPHERVSDYTQAIMDLGATLCTPSQPNCPDCPLQKTCQAHKQHRVAEFPHRPNRKTIPVKSTQMLLILNTDGAVFLQQRPQHGIWGGLWCLPEMPIDACPEQWCKEHLQASVKQTKPLPELMHTFSHFHLQIYPVLVHLSTQPALQVAEADRTFWYNMTIGKHSSSKPAPLKKGLPTPINKLLKHLSASE